MDSDSGSETLVSVSSYDSESSEEQMICPAPPKALAQFAVEQLAQMLSADPGAAPVAESEGSWLTELPQSLRGALYERLSPFTLDRWDDFASAAGDAEVLSQLWAVHSEQRFTADGDARANLHELAPGCLSNADANLKRKAAALQQAAGGRAGGPRSIFWERFVNALLRRGSRLAIHGPLQPHAPMLATDERVALGASGSRGLSVAAALQRWGHCCLSTAVDGRLLQQWPTLALPLLAAGLNQTRTLRVQRLAGGLYSSRIDLITNRLPELCALELAHCFPMADTALRQLFEGICTCRRRRAEEERLRTEREHRERRVAREEQQRARRRAAAGARCQPGSGDEDDSEGSASGSPKYVPLRPEAKRRRLDPGDLLCFGNPGTPLVTWGDGSDSASLRPLARFVWEQCSSESESPLEDDAALGVRPDLAHSRFLHRRRRRRPFGEVCSYSPLSRLRMCCVRRLRIVSVPLTNIDLSVLAEVIANCTALEDLEMGAIGAAITHAEPRRRDPFPSARDEPGALELLAAAAGASCSLRRLTVVERNLPGRFLREFDSGRPRSRSAPGAAAPAQPAPSGGLFDDAELAALDAAAAEAAADARAAPPPLLSLCLPDCDFRPAAIRSHGPRWSALRALDLSGNRLGGYHMCEDMVSVLSAAVALEDLLLRESRIPLRLVLRSCRGMPRLRRLVADGCPAGSSGAALVAEADGLVRFLADKPDLQVLRLGHCYLRQAHAEAIAVALPAAMALAELSVADNPLDRGIGELAVAAVRCPLLRRLDISRIPLYQDVLLGIASAVRATSAAAAPSAARPHKGPVVVARPPRPRPLPCADDSLVFHWQHAFGDFPHPPRNPGGLSELHITPRQPQQVGASPAECKTQLEGIFHNCPVDTLVVKAEWIPDVEA